MRSPCDPPKFDEKDWSQFDFSRWRAEGVAGDATGQAIADLATQFFQSEEWSTHFKATLPQVKDTVRKSYEAEAQALRQERQEAEQELKQRVAVADERAQALSRALQASASPPVLQARQDTFQLALRVVESSTNLGLPEITARITDPRDSNRVLQETATDRDGNAVIALPPEIAKEFDNTRLALQVVAPNGKVIDARAADISIRLNGAETQVVSLKRSADIDGALNVATAAQAANAAQLKHVLARSERLKVANADRLREIDCQLKEVETLIAQTQGTSGPTTPPTRPAEPRAPATPAPGPTRGTVTPAAPIRPFADAAPETPKPAKRAAQKKTAKKKTVTKKPKGKSK